MPTYRIVIAGFDGCLPSGIVGLVDLFALANKALARQPQDLGHFAVQVASGDGGSFHDGRGCRLKADVRLKDAGPAHAVLIPGFWLDAEQLDAAAETFRSAAPWLKAQHAQGAWLCASCAGSFVLGEAGLLDGRRCTTTWWLHDGLKRRYPKADAAWGAALIEDRRVVTAGGPMSWVDLALHVVRVLAGPEAARITADFAVVDAVPLSQSVYVPAGHVAAADPFLIKAEQAVRQLQDQSLSAVALAAQMSVSTRTLHRRLKLLTGEAPKTFIARVRLETARTLLDTSPSAIKDIALSTGYQDEGSFRRAFRRFSGMTPSGYREWSRARRSAGVGDRGHASTADDLPPY
jgi:transcriptional regulator GlxA family with amidase domain